jgi:hypothetical protein
MNPTIAPTLSPAFERARKLSRFMAVLFTIGFWLTLAGVVVILAAPFVDNFKTGHGFLQINDIQVELKGTMSVWQRLWIVLAMEMAALPVLFLMHHARRVFWHFARGEVFAAAPIAHMRLAGLWLIGSFFLGIVANILLRASHAVPPSQLQSNAWPLFTGITTFIAAHVMAEAQRIAAEHAEII